LGSGLIFAETTLAPIRKTIKQRTATNFFILFILLIKKQPKMAGWLVR
jgi:hypothetical protein